MNRRVSFLVAILSVLWFQPIQGAIIIGPYLQNVGPHSITVMCVTDTPGTGYVDYGPTASYGSTAGGSGSVTIHEVNITGLFPDTEYHYRVRTGSDQSTDAVFKTAPVKGTSGFTFLAYGDNRSNEWTHTEVALAMAYLGIRTFVLNNGDIVPSNVSDESVWQEDFFSPLAPLIREAPIYIGQGNHENYNPLYTQYFSHPSSESGSEYYYSFDYGNVHVLVADTQGNYNVGSAQYNWIESDLISSSSDPQIDWIVVLFHLPPYSTGRHGSDLSVRTKLCPLFETYGVDIVFNAHNHCYERISEQNGVVYIITGGGGAGLKDRESTEPWSIVYEKLNNFCTVTSESDTLTIVAHAVRAGNRGLLDGDMLDSVVIYSSGHWSPTAYAGPDQLVDTGEQVTLNGTDSFDGEGDSFTYSWTQISGPASVTVSNSSSAQPTFTPAATGIYEFQLVCTEGSDIRSHPDTVKVMVKDAALGGTETISPKADTWVDENDPGANHGTESALVVNQAWDDSHLGIIYLKFEIPDVAGEVLKAVLRLYVTDDKVESGGYLRVVSDTAWNETGVTWNSRPPVDGPVVGNIIETEGMDGQWIEVDVTPAVDGPGLLSLAIMPAAGGDGSYASRETNEAPELVLTYSGVSTVQLYASIDTPSTDPYIVTTGNNSTVNFSGSASGGTDPYRYDWDYEYTGSFLSDHPERTGSHSYSNGTHTAALQVTDDDTRTDIHTITILVFDDGFTPGMYEDDSDFDGDGLSDGWEINYFKNFQQNGSGNPDGDDHDNAAEYANGTDPTVNDNAETGVGTKGGCAFEVSALPGITVLMMVFGIAGVLLRYRKKVEIRR